MAASYITNSGVITTAANMQALIALFESVMTAGGWVQTADTGQTASSSWPAVSGTLTSGGYQIWRMNDSLQATKPVFVKFEFGSGSSTGSFGSWLTVGTGSDGAGNITGVLVNRQACPGTQATTLTINSYGSASTNRCSFAWQIATATNNSATMWGIERTKDATGADTNDGILVLVLGGTYTSTTNYYRYVPFVGTERTPNYGICTPVPYNTASLTSGNVLGFAPILPFGNTGATYPGFNFLVYAGTDYYGGNAIPVSIFSANHTFMLISTFGWTTVAVEITNSNFAMRYE